MVLVHYSAMQTNGQVDSRLMYGTGSIRWAMVKRKRNEELGFEIPLRYSNYYKGPGVNSV